jgi:hypothetical protein
MLGVPRDYQFNLISYTIHEAFVLAGDMYQPSDSYLVGLLERGWFYASTSRAKRSLSSSYLNTDII